MNTFIDLLSFAPASSVKHRFSELPVFQHSYIRANMQNFLRKERADERTRSTSAFLRDQFMPLSLSFFLSSSTERCALRLRTEMISKEAQSVNTLVKFFHKKILFCGKSFYIMYTIYIKLHNYIIQIWR